MQYQIYWQPQTVLHELQGAIIDFIKEDEVHYTNHFLPSGQVIASWTDAANYYQDKSFSDLPRLKPGRIYKTTRRVQNSNRMHAYLNWTFFDEKNQIISSRYQNSDFLELKVPRYYDHYQLDLMSAGTGDFTFYEVTIAEKVDGWLMEQDQQITEHLGAYLNVPNQVVSKTLRVVIGEPEFRQTDYPIQSVKNSPQAVLYLATDLLHCQDFYNEEVLKVISQAKKVGRAKDVEFVGYGLVSSLVALQYRQAVKGSKAIVANPDQLKLPSGINHYSTDLSAFLSSLPEKIEDLMSADDSLLVHYSLMENSSPIQVTHPQTELLQQLSYPEWPESRQEKLDRVQAEREEEKQRKKEERAKKNRSKKQAQGSETQNDSVLVSQQENLQGTVSEDEEKSGLATATNPGVAPDQPLPPLGPVLVPRDLPPLSKESQEVALSQLGILVNQSQVADQPKESPDGQSLVDFSQEKSAQVDAVEAEQTDVKESVESEEADAEKSAEFEQSDTADPVRLKNADMDHEKKSALDTMEVPKEDPLAAEQTQVAEDESSSTSETQNMQEKRITSAEASRQKQLLGFFTRNRT